MPEGERRSDETGDGSPPLGRIDVNIPGLRPDMRDYEGKITRSSNLFDLSAQTREVFSEKPWYKGLIGDVRKNKKSAIFLTSLGGIVIFVAGAGFEFGVRHGKDLRILPKLLNRKK